MILPAILLIAQTAPFCVTGPYGGAPQCYYYNASGCQAAAAQVNGLCTANPQAQRQPQQMRPAPEMTVPIQPYRAPPVQPYQPNPGVTALANAIRARKQAKREEKRAQEFAAAQAAAAEAAMQEAAANEAARAAAAPRPAAPPPLPPGYEPTIYVKQVPETYVLYSCRSPREKKSYETTIPAVGCVVVEVR